MLCVNCGKKMEQSKIKNTITRDGIHIPCTVSIETCSCGFYMETDEVIG